MPGGGAPKRQRSAAYDDLIPRKAWQPKQDGRAPVLCVLPRRRHVVQPRHFRIPPFSDEKIHFTVPKFGLTVMMTFSRAQIPDSKKADVRRAESGDGEAVTRWLKRGYVRGGRYQGGGQPRLLLPGGISASLLSRSAHHPSAPSVRVRCARASTGTSNRAQRDGSALCCWSAAESAAVWASCPVRSFQ